MGLLDEAYDLLDSSTETLGEIAKGAKVGEHWLRKFNQRKFRDPGLLRVERLVGYLRRRAGVRSRRNKRRGRS